MCDDDQNPKGPTLEELRMRETARNFVNDEYERRLEPMKRLGKLLGITNVAMIVAALVYMFFVLPDMVAGRLYRDSLETIRDSADRISALKAGLAEHEKFLTDQREANVLSADRVLLQGDAIKTAIAEHKETAKIIAQARRDLKDDDDVKLLKNLTPILAAVKASKLDEVVSALAAAGHLEALFHALEGSVFTEKASGRLKWAVQLLSNGLGANRAASASALQEARTSLDAAANALKKARTPNLPQWLTAEITSVETRLKLQESYYTKVSRY